MDKTNLIQLTIRLYKKTVLFPKKEPLRYKLRETADEILENIIAWDNINKPNPSNTLDINKEQVIFHIEKNLDIINSYFEVIKWQNWVSYFDILEFQQEYANILQQAKLEFKNSAESAKTPEISKKTEKIEAKPKITEAVEQKRDLDQRKQKILEILKQKEKIQVWEANDIFPNISKRTIRRDFVELLNRGLIERIGERNNTFYKFKK